MKAANLKIICEVIGLNLRHQDYDHTVAYAENLKNISTAREETVSKLLRQVIRRETTEDFAQRVAITRLLTRALWNRLRTPFNKALRLDNANVMLEKEEKELHDAYFGKTDLYTYLRNNYHPISFFDPNAHQVIAFDNFDNNTQKAKLRPEIIKSKDSLYFQYEADQLKVFVCNYGSGYKLFHHGSIDQNEQLTNEGNGIVAIEVKEMVAGKWEQDMNYLGVLNNDENTVRDDKNPVYMIIGDKYWKFVEVEPKISGIQVKRIGYIMDEYTDNRTMISPLDPAIPRIEGTIKGKSELDISLAMHCFPQKIQLVDSCKGWKDPGSSTFVRCQNGKAFGTNEDCQNCGGSGDEPIAKSGMDVILVRMGRDKNEDRDPSNMIHYAKPDIETPAFLDEFLYRQEQLCFQDIFPQNPTGEKAAAKTATEIKIDEGNMSDAIMPCVRNFEDMWKFCMHTGLNIRDVLEPKASLQFPDDINIKTLGELIADWKESEGLPVSVRKSIRKKIAKKLSVGNTDAEKLEGVRILHEPFIDKSGGDIKYIFSQNLAQMDQRILWANYDEIMTACEKLYREAWVNFAFDKQRTAILTQVAIIKSGLTTEFKIEPPANA